MVRRNGEYEVKLNENMRGGEGIVRIDNLLSEGELYQKGRLFAKITIKPGCSIGKHQHNGEMEAFYIMKGTAEFDDGGETVTLRTGDTSLTVSEGTHSIKCLGDETLEIIALILYK